VQTFIFLSSQSARADAPAAYGRTKFAAERHLLREDGMKVVILRPGLVVGPGSRGLFQRMCHLVDSLPVIPLLGGGRAPVQPIHVDDLCTAIFRCVEMAGELDKSVVALGDPQPLALAQFLQRLAMARRGRRKLTVSIPLWPIEIGVRVAEALRIPLPVTSGNLSGMRRVETMDTAGTLARLGLTLRPLDDALRPASDRAEPDPPLKDRAVRVVLVGAGRIGLVHAVTLSRLPGVALAGIVDPNARATAMLRGMGLSAPMFTSFDEALARARPDAVVIATPVKTHLPLVRQALAHGLTVMVEKPLAIAPEQLSDYERLEEEFPDRLVQVGYVMPRCPHVGFYLDALRAGRLGRVRRFLGITLLSLVEAPGASRWETTKSMSGGGVFINSGGHVLSMIRAAFGDPESVSAETLKVHSSEVEDSAAIIFDYGAFRGEQYCSWSIRGYQRQENLLVVWTDRGRLILTGSMGVFIDAGGTMDVVHQLQFDVGFNIAPDYVGAGFTTELGDLRDAARLAQRSPMNLAEASRLERLMFRVYEAGRDVSAFSVKPSSGDASPLAAVLRSAAGGRDARGGVKRVLDLRDLSPITAHSYVSAAGAAPWDEYLVSIAQLSRFAAQGATSRTLRVTLPDFLGQSRLLSAGRYREVVGQMGIAGVIAAARAAVPVLPSERALTFWVAAMGLLGGALAAVPARFEGTLLLHGYLADFALSLRRLDMLDRMLRACRRARPRARVGFHTNMAADALNALHALDTPVDDVSVLTAPGATNLPSLLQAMRRATLSPELRLTAEVGLAPGVVHRVAAAVPERWALGADAVLIGAAADPRLDRQRRHEVASEWKRVFPGLDLPDGVV
jgi:predicted dehydrogenase